MTGKRVACFGEILLRLSPTGGAAVRDTGALDVHVAGAEANVAVGLANLGYAATMLTVLPSNDVGTLAVKALAREGVDTTRIARAAGRMGLYFYTAPAGPRQGSVTYDRQGSAFALAGDYDADMLLDGANHLHVSGISLAVSERASRATRVLARAAKDRGMTLSFDGNYRPSLWQASGRDGRDEIAEMVGMADLFFGNHKDISLLLGREFSGDGGARRREAALATLDAFPGLSAMSSTARHVENGTTHHIVARIDTRERAAESAERVLTGIVDRIGTGDAFAAGVLAGWLADADDLQRAVDGGAALAALKHYQSGDFSRANAADLEAAMGAAADVSR